MGKNSGFDPTNVKVRQKPAWVILQGEIPSPTVCVLSAEEVPQNNANFDINSMPLRDLKYFVSGQLHANFSKWETILGKDGDGVYLF